MSDPELLNRLFATYGGLARWQQCQRIDCRISADGAAFLLKGQRGALIDKQASVFPHQRRVRFTPYGGTGLVGEWAGDRVSLLAASGEVLETRDQARVWLTRNDRPFLWDRLDMLYFCGYALWNYLSFPFLLGLPEVAVATRPEADGTVLDVGFPSSLPTHSMHQRFHLDADLQLRRHDYTADVIGPWAKAANFCLESTVVEGLRFHTRRRVLPQMGPLVMPRPVLVLIEIDELQPSFAQIDGI